jgi:hypothetical protein
MSEFQIKNDSTNHQYFAMTPHIIYEIGLKANEIAVYGAIKRCSGENGICIKSKANLAKSAGVCPRTIFNIIQKLCEVNKIIGKPLIKSVSRYTEDGDFDTNQIEIIDIWPENMNQFKKIIGKANNALPHATNASPHANNAGGVMQDLPEGHATVAYKEEPLKKKPFKKTTTTPTPSKGKVVDVVVSKEKIGEVTQTPPQVTQTRGVRSHRPDGEVTQTDKQEPSKTPIKKTTTTNKSKSSSSFSQEVIKAAQKAFDFVKLRAVKEPDEKWNIDLEDFMKNFHFYGVDYATEQFDYVLKRMNKYCLNKNKLGNKIAPIDDPKTYFNQACSENWAKSLHTKEEE